MQENKALYKYCLRLGDDALIQSYRFSEWCSFAPILEEDLALTNFSLDMIGRAQALLSYAGQIDGNGLTDDDLAYRRGERSFFNHLIAEMPNGDFAYSIGKMLLTSAFEYYFYTELCKSSDATLAAIANKTLKEIKYHLSHARDWTLRLGDGTEESKVRMQAAIDQLWSFTGEFFATEDVDATLADRNIGVDLAIVKDSWYKFIEGVLKEAALKMPVDGYMQTGSQKGIHTENLGHILSEMQYLQRAYPDAKW
jgi:ring-1,2-phenylacetyl-CoA epoxidase subunit PaaC